MSISGSNIKMISSKSAYRATCLDNKIVFVNLLFHFLLRDSNLVRPPVY